ncbi:MAG: gluconate 2-dehydrogenase gamma chain, partial [Caballeronia sp.]|nr:gluconate 2-dehydrogenase gamma chain [Caballeronia sp.]
MLKFLSVKRSSDSRRTFLRKSVALVPIASIAGCDLASTTPSATVAGTDTPTTQASTSPYTPVFFDAKEWAFVSAAVAGRRYFEKAIDQNGEPETITVDKSGANLAALEALNAERSTPIKV